MTEAGWVSVSEPYVRPRRPGEPEAWAHEAARHGHVGTHRLLAVEEVQPPRRVAVALGLSEGETAVVRRRLVLVDEQPTELADSYYPATIARGTGLAETRKIRGGAITLLKELGYAAHSVEEGVSARPASQEERELFGLEPGDWVLVLNRVLRTSDGTPVQADVMTMIAQDREVRYKTIIQ
ncbi:GntR family transcriptional regulator [Thermoactinospora rubra]|uniref:GntR family transcriptional regulator n=1 Tax=Thermoactinospora rubra TaxID=1088767 RepID=UPI000A1124FE|nr:UTRA domain-containing protein [Thermoactinospora rubra]